MIFLLAEKFGENVGVFLLKLLHTSFSKHLILKLGFRERRQFFGRKLANIVEICDHNIDPCMADMYYKHKKAKQVINASFLSATYGIERVRSSYISFLST
jgi:hypothetical protein